MTVAALADALVDLGLGRLALELVAKLADHLVAAHAPGDLLDRRLAPELLHQAAVTRTRLLIVSTMWTGMRIVRAWSAIARVIACRIHHVAYVLNLKPFCSRTFDRTDEADVALLDEVQEAHAAADVLLRDATDQAQVGLGQALAGIGACSTRRPGASRSGMSAATTGRSPAA